MNFIRELFNAAMSGRHIGKGIKLTRRGKYEDALYHYRLSVVYEGRSGEAPNPATREYLARTYARLGNLKNALVLAEESYDLYRQLNLTNTLIAESLSRVERLIAGIKAGNIDDINKMLS